MLLKRLALVLISVSLVMGGCAKRVMVGYDKLEETNSVEVVLVSGKKVIGTVESVEPYQIVVMTKDRGKRAIKKSSIKLIRRRPPVYDDLGKGISEEEIEAERTNKNAIIYGVGGGLLSFGTSFFAGSLAAQNSGSILAATTLAGGTIGTVLFVQAGRAMDRKQAIERVRLKRISTSVEMRKSDADVDSLKVRKQIEEEKKKQQELRLEREKLLKKLKEEEKKKKKKKREGNILL